MRLLSQLFAYQLYSNSVFRQAFSINVIGFNGIYVLRIYTIVTINVFDVVHISCDNELTAQTEPSYNKFETFYACMVGVSGSPKR